jgi:UDP-N-acetylmuramyl pentapeptide synthase
MYALLEKPVGQRFYLGLVRIHRRRLRNVVFIGVTGSAGKTTAKGLIAGLLASRFDGVQNPKGWKTLRTMTLRTMRSGLPGAILNARSWHRYCLLEMGVHQPGALQELVSIAQPSIAVVTNVRTDHLRAFGSAEAIAAEKGRLVTALPADGTAILNADDPHVLAMASTFGGRSLMASQTTRIYAPRTFDASGPSGSAFRWYTKGRVGESKLACVASTGCRRCSRRCRRVWRWESRSTSRSQRSLR